MWMNPAERQKIYHRPVLRSRGQHEINDVGGISGALEIITQPKRLA